MRKETETNKKFKVGRIYYTCSDSWYFLFKLLSYNSTAFTAIKILDVSLRDNKMDLWSNKPVIIDWPIDELKNAKLLSDAT